MAAFAIQPGRSVNFDLVNYVEGVYQAVLVQQGDSLANDATVSWTE